MTKNSENGRLDDIAVLRTIAIIGVVLYHAFWIIYFPPFTMLLADPVPLSPVYESIFHTWLSPRMSLFIFISGYLYSYLYNKRGKYIDTGQFIKTKFIRLIIPYIIFTVIMGLSLSNLTLSSFLNGYMHLWFILMLFWCFVFIRFMSKVKNSVVLHISMFAVFSIIFGVIPVLIPEGMFFGGLNFGLKYFCWFWLGYIIFLDKEKLKFLFTKYSIVGLFFIWLACCLYLESFPANDRLGFSLELDDRFAITISRYIVYYFSHLFFVLLVYITVEKAFQKGIIKMKGWIESVNKCSYGIYIFHLWIPFLIIIGSKGTKSFFLLQSLAVNYPVLFPLMLFAVMFSVSFLLSVLLLKKPWGRFVLGS